MCVNQDRIFRYRPPFLELPKINSQFVFIKSISEQFQLSGFSDLKNFGIFILVSRSLNFSLIHLENCLERGDFHNFLSLYLFLGLNSDTLVKSRRMKACRKFILYRNTSILVTMNLIQWFWFQIQNSDNKDRMIATHWIEFSTRVVLISWGFVLNYKF